MLRSVSQGADQSSLLTALKAKSIPDGEIKQPVEGLLYFRMDGKNKLKDLTVLYKGDGGGWSRTSNNVEQPVFASCLAFYQVQRQDRPRHVANTPRELLRTRPCSSE